MMSIFQITLSSIHGLFLRFNRGSDKVGVSGGGYEKNELLSLTNEYITKLCLIAGMHFSKEVATIMFGLATFWICSTVYIHPTLMH